MVKLNCPHCQQSFISYRQLENHMELRHPESFEIFAQKPSKKVSKKLKPIIVDGNNISYLGVNKPAIKNITLIESHLKKRGYLPKIVVSAKLKYDIDQPRILMNLIRMGRIIEVGSGDNDDIEILELSIEYNAPIVSNDRFLEYREVYPRIEEKLRKVTINNNSFIISDF